uniref:RNA helicase n=1 Tax=Phallusia mammillata TaxID=59560 RepID=A0A6F9DBL1_9ASCI|nr:probable ATP-dependent RNA helicase DDX56 [Phallusia mammillata]
MEDDEVPKKVQFHEMGLDNRILKSIANLGWFEPTAIQEKAIPFALDGKDILSRARTGSGKTAAYAIPIIQRILNNKKSTSSDEGQQIRALVLVPSRELSKQAYVMMQELISCCSQSVSCIDVSHESNPELLRPLLSEKPDVVIGTPSRVLAQVNAENLDLSTLQWLVMDEADLLFSFGYEDDLKSLNPHFPNNYQAFITSATFTEDVEALKKLILHNPITLNLNESQLPAASQLTQYHVFNETEDDKYLLIYALLKLKLIRGKSLLFVNTVNRCYRLKLFLEQFSIFCCVLNSELPVNIRCHVVEQYNQGLYDIIIATDESSLIDLPANETTNKPTKKMGKMKKKRKVQSKEYCVSRGIDFQNVSNVINFDFPKTVQAYVHRVGRTARGDKMGTALSFVLAEEMDLLKEAQKQLSGSGEEEDTPLKPYQFKMEEIEGFRYRCKDAIRSVTKTRIREARVKEIRREMLNSEKLKTYFEENPNDLHVLRHDAVSQPVKVKKHMKNVPEYLIPPTLKSMYTGVKATPKRSLPAPSHAVKEKRHKQGRQRTGQLNPKYKKQMEDPLKSFKYVKK